MPDKKKIHKLKFDLEDDFQLIGIASHENDYRLCWALNKKMGFEFVKSNDLIIAHPKHKIEIHYSKYFYEDEMDYLNYYLLSNKSDKGFLLPDHKNIDFLLKITGNPDAEILNQLTLKLKKIDIVITAFILDNVPEKIRKVLIF
jgi:hypothetical protein